MTTRDPQPGVPVVDFDLTSSHPALSFWPKLDALREQGAVLYNAAGFWMVMSYDLCREGLQRPDIFTSDAIVVADPEPSYRWIPTMINPPEHVKFRRILTPVFSPPAVARVEPLARQVAARRVEVIRERGTCDVISEFCEALPTDVFLAILGLPIEDAPQLLTWVRAVIDTVHLEPEQQSRMVAAHREMTDYFRQLLLERRHHPGDPTTDFISRLCNATVDGALLTDDQILNICYVLPLAGLDTVKSQLGYAFLHLARFDRDRRHLVAHPELWEAAVEEFLRLYPVVFNVGNKVGEDHEFHGCPLRKGDMVMFTLGSACHDPDVFDRPTEFDLDRPQNQHLGFSVGPHFCLGAHLARMELRVALEEWHKPIPNYRLSIGDLGLERGGGVLSLEELALEWPPR
jgi:cytochrome P450